MCHSDDSPEWKCLALGGRSPASLTRQGRRLGRSARHVSSGFAQERAAPSWNTVQLTRTEVEDAIRIVTVSGWYVGANARHRRGPGRIVNLRPGSELPAVSGRAQSPSTIIRHRLNPFAALPVDRIPLWTSISAGRQTPSASCATSCGAIGCCVARSTFTSKRSQCCIR